MSASSSFRFTKGALNQTLAARVVLLGLGALAVFGTALNADAKPISFADGTTFMHEREGNMIQTELFYAPKVWWSIGMADTTMRSDDKLRETRYQHLQANWLLKRWNLPGAQGNLFASFGYGFADTVKQGVPMVIHPGHTVGQTATYSESARRYTFMGDYETRQFYSSFKMDTHQTSRFLDRTDTVQLGLSPYAHDYDELAVWFAGQVKRYRGMNDKTEAGGFVRLFKNNIWVEIGMTEGRKSQIMLMMNY
ncbi:MAG: hypothetical protein LW838_10175 [Nitrosomonadaceae bacterium]|nr:hypothetical protein [Nitrosomonadaceae bacterium]